MKHYELANISKNEAGETSVVAKGEITAEQYLEIRSWFKFTYFYHVCQSIEHMTLESGEDLANYFAELENYTGPFTKDYNKFLTTANKLLISYLSFLRIYVDVVSHAISRKSKEKFEEFNNATHIVYDTLLGYRFFSRMRNYVVHYDVPLTSITCSVSNGIQVTCKRKSLLEYNGWGSVKKEIEQLPEEIDIFPFIGECQAAVKRLYLVALETIWDDVIKANENLHDICSKYAISAPIIICVDESEQPHFEQLPLEHIKYYLEDLNQYPEYNITLIEPEQA